MDLPTYTNIWRIEKRLYKLYDFRLPAPLPINWIIVFTGITVPYVLLLIAIGLPFNHDLLWLYVLPPGVLTWLTTRPVIEGKRLPELLESQIRYVTEPRVWCRMAPLAEKDQIMVTARVWHSNRKPAERVAGRAPSMTALLERGSMARRKVGLPLRPAGLPALGSTVPEALATGASTDATLAAMAAGGRTVAAPEVASNGAKGRAGKRRLSKGTPAKRGAARGSSAPQGGDDQATASGSRRSVAALTSGQAAPAPPLPGYGSRRQPGGFGMAPLRPAAAPVLATMPAHATPSLAPVPSVPAAPMAVHPETPATGWPLAPAAQPPAAQAHAPAPAAERPGAPVRARGIAGGMGRIEVTHSGPAQRPVPPVPPPDPAKAWPTVAPAKPLPPVIEPPAPVSPAAVTGSEATVPAERDSEPAGAPVADRKAPRRELFSLLANTSPVTGPQPGDANGRGTPVAAAQSAPPAPPTVAAQPVPPAPPTVAAQPVPPAPPAAAPGKSRVMDGPGNWRLVPSASATSSPPAAPARGPVAPVPAAPSAPRVPNGADVPGTAGNGPVSPPAPVASAEATEPAETIEPAEATEPAETIEPAEATEAAVQPVPAVPGRAEGQLATSQTAPAPAAAEPAPAAAPVPAAPMPAAPVPAAPVPAAAAPAAPVSAAPVPVPVPVVPVPVESAPSAPAPAAAPVVLAPATTYAAPAPPKSAPAPAAPAPAAPAPAVPAPAPANAGNDAAEQVVQPGRRVPSIERAMSGPSRDRNLSWHTKVKIVAGAGQGPGARDQEALDRARARLPLKNPKRVLVLGCTSGAGQTVTAMMTGHILASLREEPVAAVDLHDGTLARYTAPAALLREVLDGARPQSQSSPYPDGLPPRPRTERNRTQSQARLDVIASEDPLRDGDERLLAEHLGRHYSLTILDPGATGLTRLLKITDQLVIVAPASIEAASALADTRDWLDAHGFAELAMHSVTLVNGVSRRSLSDVEAAEAVARGRCRAIVRVPWDEMLPMGDAGPSTLHPQTRVAYTALAGVLVAGMAAAPVRRPQ